MIDPGEAARQARDVRRGALLFARAATMIVVIALSSFVAAVATVWALTRGIEWVNSDTGAGLSDLTQARRRIDELGGDCGELAGVRDFRSMEADRAAARGDAQDARDNVALMRHAEGRLAAARC